MDIQFKHVIIPSYTTPEEFIELTKHLQGVTVSKTYYGDMILEARNCTPEYCVVGSRYKRVLVVGYVNDKVVALNEMRIWKD